MLNTLFRLPDQSHKVHQKSLEESLFYLVWILLLSKDLFLENRGTHRFHPFNLKITKTTKNKKLIMLFSTKMLILKQTVLFTNISWSSSGAWKSSFPSGTDWSPHPNISFFSVNSIFSIATRGSWCTCYDIKTLCTLWYLKF